MNKGGKLMLLVATQSTFCLKGEVETHQSDMTQIELGIAPCN